jgi:5-methylcytosine-specific restriction endonuclease McrA
MSVINKAIVLSLNANWERIGYITPKKAIIAATGGIHTRPALVMRIETDENGKVVETIPVTWDEWVKLPVDASHLALETSKGPIRCPLVIVEAGWNKMRLKLPKLSNDGIHERDGLIDQYTGEKLERHEATVDHVISRDLWKKRGLRGSPNQWTNMVTCRGDRNFRKGNKPAGSLGMVLRRRPKAPKQVPISFLVKEPRHPHQKPFFPS